MGVETKVQNVVKFKVKFAWDAWFHEFQIRNLKIIGVLSAVFLLLSENLNELYYQWVIKPILKDVPVSGLADLFVIQLLLLAIWYFIEQLWAGLVPTIDALINCIIIFLFYFFLYRSNEDYSFLKLTFYNPIAYADLILLAILLRLNSYKSYKNVEGASVSRFSMLEDSPSITQYEDIYNRKGYVDHVVNHIFSTSSKTAFTIGIVGEWGAGKSDFINRVKDGMMWDDKRAASLSAAQIANIKNTICFDFNPWRVNKSENIPDEFFASLSRELRPLNQSISNKIKEYSKKLFQPSKELHFRFVDTLIGEWNREETIEEQYQLINTAIKLSGKRIIVFIDDMDRLSGKEIIEVLRIVRNSANFGNVFFVIGFDYRYVVKVIENSKDIENVDEYLRKFFQLQISLPVFRKDVLVTQIRSFLINDNLTAQEKVEIETVLENLTYGTGSTVNDFFPGVAEEGIVEALLDNIRDVKRFVNSFRMAYNVIGNEVDINDLFVLELIKNKNINVFQKLRDKSFLGFETNKPQNYILKTDIFDKFYDNRSSTEKSAIQHAIDYLLEENSQKRSEVGFRSIVNFYRYFAYQIFDQISFSEYQEIWMKDESAIVAKFNNWIGKNMEGELIRISLERSVFNSKAYLKKVVLVSLLIDSDNDFWMDYVIRLLYTNRNGNIHQYFGGSSDEYKEFLTEIFENSDILPFRRARIAHRFLVDFSRAGGSEGTTGLDHKYFLDVIYSLFDTYLKSSSLNDYNTLISFLYLNDESRTDDNRVTLNKNATRRFREVLISNESLFRLYLSHIFRPSQIPYNGNIVFEPMLGQIFPDLNDAIAPIDNLQPINDSEKKFFEFAISNLSHYYNTKNAPFKLLSTEEGELVYNKMKENGVVKESF